MEEESGRGRSLAETPTWSVATVTTVLVAVCFVVERSIHRFAKWLVKTKRKPLLAALDKIKQELMLLGLISLILVQSSRIISDICVESKIYSSRFYPCTLKDFDDDDIPTNHSIRHSSLFHGRRLNEAGRCKKGFEPFVSLESMEQLHRFLFVLGVTHVLYSCLTMLLSMIKIYSWKKWEMEAHSKLLLNKPDQTRRVFRRQTTFVIHQTSHPWSKNKVLIWLLCFLRQFVRTVTKADYTALRMGFITNHRLRFSYDFHSYMVRTMEDEFRDIVGISWQLWGYAILCIFFNLHGLNFYFWIAFIPAILILLLGTKLQHVIAKLALENTAVVDQDAGTPVRPRDELFWFDKPELLLWLIQFITFQNAFEMASFIWSWWQIKAHTCFMKHHAFVYTRLISGLVVQFWCSYSILPLYAIVTQMGSRFKKALIAEDIRESLHGWRKRVKDRAAKRDSSHHGSIFSTQTSTLSESAKRFASYHGSIFSKQSSSISVSESAKRSASHHGNLFSTPTPTVLEPIKLSADVTEAQVEVIENELKAVARELPTVMERELSIIPDNDVVCEIERVMSLESHISKRYDGGSKVYDNELYNYNDDVLEVNVDSEEERLMEHSMSMRLQEVSDEALAIELSQLSSSDEESDSDSSDEDQQEEEAPLNSSESPIADDAPKVFP